MKAAVDHAMEAWACPLARTFGEPHKTCIGDKCAVWRWLPVTIDHPLIQSAIKREIALIAQEKGKNSSPVYHKEAVRRVMANPAGYTIDLKPDTGFCGLGGRP